MKKSGTSVNVHCIGYNLMTATVNANTLLRCKCFVLSTEY